MELKYDEQLNKALQQLTFLVPERRGERAINQITQIMSDFGIQTSIKQTNELRHGLYKFIWKGQLRPPFVNFAKDLLAQNPKGTCELWMAHLTKQEAGNSFNPSLHDSNFSVQVAECSLGALTGPFTFCTHFTWTESECEDIYAIFDFDRDVLRVHFEAWQHLEAGKLEILFTELKRAFIVEPEVEDGNIFFNFYIYLSSFPSCWGAAYRKMKGVKKQKIFRRVTVIPGAEADIGKCSMMKLSLMNVSERDLITLLDKLDASGFNVWWTTLGVISPKPSFTDDDNAPWPIRWLISEGYQLSADDIDFLNKHEDKLYSALQGVISREIIVNVMQEMESFLQDKTAGKITLLPKHLPSNYTLIRKVVITPTRIIYLPPEPVQMNRVLRKYNNRNFITVLFRDENQQFLAPRYRLALEEPIQRIKDFLLTGLKVEGRTYQLLGCSNSQLRQHGCWMYANDPQNETTVEDIRHWMGDLAEVRCVALYVSRLGQFFTSSVKTVDLSGQDYKIVEIPDVERNGYCFTDGVGKISKQVAQEVAKQYGIASKCSAFQIRLGGCKGVLVVDPQLPKGEIHIRPSMKKFKSSHQILEVVDYSLPRRAYLNRQVITLLSQLGIADEVFFKLQDQYVQHLLEMFTSNETACQELDNEYVNLNVREVSEKGINITSDAFFRSLLMVRYEERLNDLLARTRIPLPVDKGRVLIGVVDETGRLKSGEVFIQYSTELHQPAAETTIVKGKVMITKSPCLHPGDLRLLEAVDYPDLHHLVDCVVFPIQGDRPHCNEISGSDFDGDLYWVTWYPELILKESHRPMTYEQAKRKVLPKEPGQKDIINFIGDFIKNSEIGYIANAHLALADAEDKGVFSDKCLKLAWLHSVAVDFLKTGEPSYMNPNLKPAKYPDFMMKREKNTYDSQRILGKLYRNASQLCQSKELHHETLQQTGIAKRRYNDQLEVELQKFDIPQSYKKQTERYYDDYAARMQDILDTYGISDESRLFACSIYRVKQKILFKSERHELAYLMKVEIQKLKEEFLDTFEAKDESVDPRTKAMTWYKVAYERGRFRSFCWIASGVLASVMNGNEAVNVDLGICDDTNCSDGDTSSPKTEEDIECCLKYQITVCELFTQLVTGALPALQSTLFPVSCQADCQIPSYNIYIELKHSDDRVLEREFAEICLVILGLNVTESFLPFRIQGRYLTRRGMELKLIAGHHLFTVHIYRSGAFSKELEKITIGLNSPKLGKCLQVLSHFWILYARQELHDIVPVLYICHMAVTCLPDDSSMTTYELLLRFFRQYTNFEALVTFQKASPLYALPATVLQVLQQNLFHGLQLLVLAGTYTVLHSKGGQSSSHRLRKLIIMSANTSGFVREEKAIVCQMFELRSGCRVELKRIPQAMSHVLVAEGFGTKEQLNRLAAEIRHFENVVSHIQNIGSMPRISGNEEIIFEAAADENDRLIVIPYEKSSYIRGKRRTYTVFVGSTSSSCALDVERRNVDRVIDQYCRIISDMRDHYDEYYLGDIRIICRLSCFHFTTKQKLQNLTVKEFIHLLGDRSRPVTKSYFPANVDFDDVCRILNEQGLRVAGEPDYRNVVTIVVEAAESAVGERRAGVEMKFNLNRKLEIEADKLRHPQIRWGQITFVRKMKVIPGERLKEKMADILISVQTMRNVREAEVEPYTSVRNRCREVLIVDPDRSDPEDDMPYLRVHPEFLLPVRFIRQKKVSTYRYDVSALGERADHFIANAVVELTRVREYKIRSNEDEANISEYTDLSIVLPTVQPLHYEDDHRDIIRNIMELGLKIGNSMK